MISESTVLWASLLGIGAAFCAALVLWEPCRRPPKLATRSAAIEHALFLLSPYLCRARLSSVFTHAFQALLLVVLFFELVFFVSLGTSRAFSLWLPSDEQSATVPFVFSSSPTSFETPNAAPIAFNAAGNASYVVATATTVVLGPSSSAAGTLTPASLSTVIDWISLNWYSGYRSLFWTLAGLYGATVVLMLFVWFNFFCERSTEHILCNCLRVNYLSPQLILTDRLGVRVQPSSVDL